MANVRITDQTTDTLLVDGDYVIVDSQNEGTRKYNLGKGLAEIKEDLQDLQEEIEGGGGGSGMSAEFKQALHNILEKVAFVDEDGQDYLNALDSAMYPPVTAISLNTNSLSFATLNSTQQLTATTTPSGGAVTWSSSNTSIATVSSSGLVTSKGYGSATITATSGSVSATCSVAVTQATLSSISAVYTQSGTVYDTDSLDDLKTDLVVTAHWSNSTTSTVASADYTLSGTLTEGTSTITVSYGGKTTTFNVTVTHDVTYIQNGLIHQWDAINNTLNGHSSSTTTWYDLKGLDHLNMNNSSLSTWESNAIVFPGTGGQYLQGSLTPEAIESKTVELCFSPSTVHGAGILIPFKATAKGKLCIYSDNSFCVNGYNGKTYLTGESSLLDLHHIAVTIDSSGNITQAYANGSPATLGTASHSFADTASYVTVGQPDARNNSSYPYNGRVYSIRMYNRELSDSEIANNYSVDVTRFNLGD